MSASDPFGNPVTVADAASASAVCAFAEGFVASELTVLDILPAAGRDDSPLVQACAAMLHMFAESRAAPEAARPHLARAQASRVPATARERRFVAAIRAWVDGDVVQAIRLHDEQSREHPRDLVSVKLGQYHRFNLGDSPGMLRLALEVAPAACDLPWLHGMAAFGYEQCHLLGPAEAAARRGIAMRRKEPWAHHALAHVMLTQGRFEEGRAFMAEVSDTWVGLNSFMQTHNGWHQALFDIELGDGPHALGLYDRQVWGVAKDYTQDQIGAVSLLARLELAGVDVGDRWADVADHLLERVDDHVLPFLDMHYAYGLARADRVQADALLASMTTWAARAPDHCRDAWQRVALPAARGLVAHARGRYGDTVEWLGGALPRLAEIGGSHAQRDLFEQFWLDALVRTGRLASAQHWLQQRASACPASVRLRRALQPVYRGLGLESVAAT